MERRRTGVAATGVAPGELRRGAEAPAPPRASVGGSERRVDYGSGRQILSVRVDDFQQRGLLQDPNRLLRIVDAGQLDDDLVVAAGLDERLADAKTVHPPLERLASAFQGAAIERLTRDRARLQDDLETALQVETLANGVRGPDAADVNR